ncbi:hypothetical protein [Mangrovimonas sp. YM274]|uniref:hypothetical protein n=1 Tax=Mangrovimonas sp. YM274 TaxID=3070660 RepID=UPI0027DE2377|nr:hypothetical protein [Mangrovimonas sp. YM274]WMI68257.1 hypothetical protein RBH95_14040 [Mangrovimonas sp. YM274]
MNLITIIIIGIILLGGIVFFATQVEKKTSTFQSVKIPLDIFEKEFGKIEINGGTLRFWGNWFGKPMDNYHEIINVELDKTNNILILNLNDGEKVKLWNPSDLEIGQKELRIKKADKILLEWHLYGENKTEENLRFESYRNNGISIEFETNFMPDKRNVECHKSEPALSIIGY